MTNFYAVYLFIIIAIVLLAMGLYFKRGWLLLLGALCWVFSAFYCFATATATTQYIYFFGAFSLIAGLPSGLVDWQRLMTCSGGGAGTFCYVTLRTGFIEECPQ